ncbi:hypothetical protein AMTR_s00017p00186120 [Amborella trichopoda]|uniref:Uncharacterized protein n=1 Tax=Amborella trichopoda TaxID=13333 RepID=W1PLR7_AMBTC|nr:hypothetical protein AMTR_s00017p00186120 [Amborella trichopoda]
MVFFLCKGTEREIGTKEDLLSFLRLVNGEYATFRENVLGCETLPSLGTVFSFLQCEETRRKIMAVLMGDTKISALFPCFSGNIGGGCFGSHVGGRGGGCGRGNPTADEKDRLECTHCGRLNTQDKHVGIWLDAQGETFQGKIQQQSVKVLPQLLRGSKLPCPLNLKNSW